MEKIIFFDQNLAYTINILVPALPLDQLGILVHFTTSKAISNYSMMLILYVILTDSQESDFELSLSF